MANVRGINWCFTENSNAQDFYDNLESLFNSLDGLRYICGQLELAPNTGHLHFQGYLQLTKVQRRSWVKKNISRTASLETQYKKSTNEQARDYCKKPESRYPNHDFIEFGEFNPGRGRQPGCGRRTDLVAFTDAIKSGGNIDTLLNDGYHNELARYPKFYQMVKARYMPEREVPQVELYIGDTGTGKTRKAFEENTDIYVVPLSNGTFWLDGYDGQDTALLDDFCGKLSKVGLGYTLRLLDRYPLMVPVKGGHTWFTPKKVIITTNIHPCDWYDFSDRKIQEKALCRRLTKVIVFETGSDPVEITDDVWNNFWNNSDYIVKF